MENLCLTENIVLLAAADLRDGQVWPARSDSARTVENPPVLKVLLPAGLEPHAG
jgi:hypothetical protein